MISFDDNEAPELGSAEAAVRSCVSLMAAVMGQREELLAYWLDLYYQVRLAYERENTAEPDPTVLRRGDLYPVMRELMQDALKSAVRGEAKERMERKKAGKTDPSTPLAEPGTSHASRASGCVAQDDTGKTDCHEPKCGSRNDEKDGAAQADESAPP